MRDFNIYDQTVFFVGAGASASYSFPCGEKLVDEICDNIRTECDIRNYLVDKVGISQSDLNYFAQTFIDARDTSMNEFLAIREDLKDLARKVVGAKLITYENPHIITGVRSDWLTTYLRHLLKDINCCADAYGALSKVSFYTLNYDRTIESILFRLLKARFYRGQEEELSETNLIDTSNRVIHPHGCLGKFSLVEGEYERPYSMDFPDPENFKSICEQIRFWDDGSNGSNEPFSNPKVNHLIKMAKQIFILGFGFHEGILKRFDEDAFEGKKVYCTRKGIDDRKWNRILDLLYPNRNRSGIFFGTEEQLCDDFLKELLEG